MRSVSRKKVTAAGTAPTGEEPLVTKKTETTEETVWAPLASGRPSGFTEPEMRILVRQVRRHIADPKMVSLYSIAQTYNVSHNTLARVRNFLLKGEIPFRTRPNMETREPFRDRMIHHKAVVDQDPTKSILELGEQKMAAIEEEKGRKEDLKKIRPFDRVRDILLKTDQGKAIPETAIHEILKLLAGTTQAEGVVIKALQASREVAQQSGSAVDIGPPPPLTDGEKVTEASFILRAVGMELGVRALKQAYGGALVISRRKPKKVGEGEEKEA